MKEPRIDFSEFIGEYNLPQAKIILKKMKAKIAASLKIQPIKTLSEYRKAMTRMEEIIKDKKLKGGKEANALFKVIHAYEEKHWPIKQTKKQQEAFSNFIKGYRAAKSQVPFVITGKRLAKELFLIHHHTNFLLKFTAPEKAEAYLKDPGEIVYREKELLVALKKLGLPEPDWDAAAEDLTKTKKKNATRTKR